ncbi:MAG: hypothetical protein R2822_06585 [Spirosomataceae bacterium]
MSGYRIEQYLYIANWIVVAFLISSTQPTFADKPLAPRKWAINLGVLLVFFALMALMLINSHGEVKHAQKRFGVPPVVEETK